MDESAVMHASDDVLRNLGIPDDGGQRVSGATRVVGAGWTAGSGERPCGREKKAWRAVARAL